MFSSPVFGVYAPRASGWCVVKHFTLKKMNKNDDSNYNYLIDEYKQVITILQTLSNSSVKKI